MEDIFQDQITFVRGLAAQCPQLQQLYDNHVREYDELLSHLLMADFARFVVEATMHPEDGAGVEKILGVLEDGLNLGCGDIHELIVVSFVENLLGAEDAVVMLLPLMEPALRACVQEVCPVESGLLVFDQGDPNAEAKQLALTYLDRADPERVPASVINLARRFIVGARTVKISVVEATSSNWRTSSFAAPYRSRLEHFELIGREHFGLHKSVAALQTLDDAVGLVSVGAEDANIELIFTTTGAVIGCVVYPLRPSRE
jgi:hypothetical protein